PRSRPEATRGRRRQPTRDKKISPAIDIVVSAGRFTPTSTEKNNPAACKKAQNGLHPAASVTRSSELFRCDRDDPDCGDGSGLADSMARPAGIRQAGLVAAPDDCVGCDHGEVVQVSR